jgi:hypothetical protein
MYGLKQDDLLTLKWLTPEGEEWFRFDYDIDKDYWYYYFWSFIDIPDAAFSGDWSVELFRNGESVVNEEQI